MVGTTFSDEWYRVSELCVGLLPTVKIHKQQFRDRIWYVLTDTFSQRFYRVSPEVYAFLARLNPEKSVDETWREMIREHPEAAPGQQEAGQILSQLHFANLLYFSGHPDAQGIFERSRKNLLRARQAQLASFLFVRIPLWDPNDWLDRIAPRLRWLFCPPVALAWAAVVLVGVWLAVQNSEQFLNRTQGMLAPSNWPWLYVCLASMKILHEFGHALTCKHYGGAVHTMGVMFLIFMPLPYVDATASWAFRQRNQRALVGGAGVVVELFLAAIGSLVWTLTGAGLINGLSFNAMIVGSVSSLLFNGNPLLRYDGYYVLSDLVEIPNLYQKSQQHWLSMVQRWLMGDPEAESPAADRREWAWLTTYGALSYLYRPLITFGIVMYLLDRWFVLGIILLVFSIAMWLLVPLWKWFRYLSGPLPHHNRTRAIATSVALAVLLGGSIGWLPLPNSITAPGIAESEQSLSIYTQVGGVLHILAAENGDDVKAGQLLAVLQNTELEQDLVITSRHIVETQAMEREALLDSPADSAVLQSNLEMLRSRFAELRWRQSQLTVRAPHDGCWISPGLHEQLGRWIKPGDQLGVLIDTHQFRFTAVVSQEQADELFQAPPVAGRLRLHGQADCELSVGPLDDIKVIPFERRRLASAALGWAGGGDIAVRADDRGGQSAAIPFFEIHVSMPRFAEKVTVVHGISGKLCLRLPPRTLYAWIDKAMRQLAQKRYGML